MFKVLLYPTVKVFTLLTRITHIHSMYGSIHIATVTSDMSGMFSYQWCPEIEGKYTIMATFEGSEAYGSSYAETAVAVDPAPAPSGPIEPVEPTAEAPFITTEVAILIAAVIVAVAVIVGFWIIRKRK
jgi:hypothetical protein